MILCDIYVVYEGSNFIFTYLHCKRILSSSLGSVQYVGTKWYKTDVQCVAVKLSSSQAGTHLVFSNSQFSPLRDNNWQDALCFCLRHAMPAVLDLQPITVWLRPPQRPDRAVSFLSGWKKELT